MTMRPAQLCALYDSTYKDCFKHIEAARLDILASGASWPGWCFAPLAIAHSMYDFGDPFTQVQMCSALTGLYTWRGGGKHVLKFHDETLRELWNSDIGGNLPCDILMRFPFHGAYIVTPPDVVDRVNMQGFFVWLEYDVNLKRAEMRYLFDLAPRYQGDPEGGLVTAMLDLDVNGRLEDVIQKTYRTQATGQQYTDLVNALRSVVSICLYICSKNAEIGERPLPRLPQSPSKNRVFAPQKEQTWEVGYRIGARLVEARMRMMSTRGNTGRTVFPHIRRAHWHGYWEGSRLLGRQKLVPQWINPVLVGDYDDDLPVTEREVQ